MRKFKYDDGTDGIEYETLHELLQLSNIKVTEYNGNYYVEILEKAPYYSTMYKVDKKTGKASYMDTIDYILDIEDKATPIDPESLKRAS